MYNKQLGDAEEKMQLVSELQKHKTNIRKFHMEELNKSFIKQIELNPDSKQMAGL